MAGDWIKVQNTTPDKPEVFQIAELLELDPDAVVGKLVRVWVWADQQLYSGNAGSVTAALLDRVTGVTGFTDAMVRTGWLDQTDEGLVFPNFERHNGKSAKQRSLTRIRVESHRKNSNAGSVTDALPEKRREEKSKKKPPTPLDKILAMGQTRSEKFQAALRDWCQHRKEIRKPLTVLQAEKLFKKYTPDRDDEFVAAVDYTVERGWQGLRQPDATTVGRHRLPTVRVMT